MPRPRTSAALLASLLVVVAACATAPARPDPALEPLPPRPAAGCAAALAQAEQFGFRRADEPPRQIAARFPTQTSPTDASGRMVNTFLVQYSVDTIGLVDSSSVVVGPPVTAPFQAALRRLAPEWRYRPAVLGGCPVPYVVVDTVRIFASVGEAR
jgi:hypothetical protein